MAAARAAWGPRALFLLPLVALAVFVANELHRPDLLLVGNITIDLVDGKRPTGGAVSYASVYANALKARTCVITVAGDDADLGVFAGSRLHVLPSNSTLTFEHTYTWWGHARKLRVTANPNVTVAKAHVPRWCLKARAVLLGPLTLHDVDAGSFLTSSGWLEALASPRQVVGLMGQGFQRRLEADGRVTPLAAPSQQLLEGLGPRVSVFLSDVETEAWPAGAVAAVAAASARLLVTKGEAGAEEWGPGGAVAHVPATQVAQVADTNGAGDTFATAYMLALLRGDPKPGATASWAASRAVMQPQACKPRCAPALVVGGADGLAPLTDAERLEVAFRALLRDLTDAAAPLLRAGWVDRAVSTLGGALREASAFARRARSEKAQ